MNQTEQVFLYLLRDYVCGKPLRQLPQCNWSALYDLAQMHNVTGIVGRVLADLSDGQRPPAPFDAAFRQAVGQTLINYEQRATAVQVMEQVLESNSVPYLIVKGACTASAYPDPSLRTSGDTDVILTPENQKRAVQLLQQHGFIKKVTHQDVDMLTLRGYEFELHNRLESVNDAASQLLSDPFAPNVSTPIGNGRYALLPAYELYYTVLHLLYHIKTGGAGMRMLLDTDLLLRREPTLLPDVLKLAADSGLVRSFDCIFFLCHQWLATPLICDVPALDRETQEKFAAVIVGGGVFGHGNGNTGAVFLARKQAADGSKKPFLRLKALLAYCFPGLAYMTYQFAYLEKRPYLLGFAYLHRFVRGLMRNRDHSVTAIGALTGKNQGANQLSQVWAELEL